MIFETTIFDGVFILVPKVFSDKRGFFHESYSKEIFTNNGINFEFIQDAHSFNKHKNTFRGLHYQMNPKSQTKLVRVVSGEVIDFVVDLRKKSPTYGKHMSTILSSKNHKQILIPTGFAHGFLTTTDDVVVLYKMDNFYAPKYERTLNIKSISLESKIDIKTNIIISEKDKNSPLLNSIENNFLYEGLE